MTDLSQQPWWPELTPGMRAVVNGMARAKYPPYYTQTPQQARQAYRAGAQVLEENWPQGVHTEDRQITAQDGQALAARVYYRASDGDNGGVTPAPLSAGILFLHGGGFTVGGIDTHDVLCARLADLAQASVVSLAYRLAPEHRFPTAVMDSWDALQWLCAEGKSWGLDGARLAVAGDSAGGTLAAVMALMARDAGLTLRAQCLIYPGTTAHQDTPSHRRYAEGPILSAPLISWFFAQYIERAQRTDWRFAPLCAETLEDLAPALLVLAECDPLVDEGLAYADQLRMAGVAVDLELYRGVGHEFIKMGRALPEAAKAHAAIGSFLRQALA